LPIMCIGGAVLHHLTGEKLQSQAEAYVQTPSADPVAI
jgi:hypothetical protein